MRRVRWLVGLLVVAVLSVGASWWLLRPAIQLPGPAPQVAGRQLHTATLLRDGTILVVGGRPSRGSPTAVTERYDPRTGMWTAAGRLSQARADHTASLLPDGSGLIVGGTDRPDWTGHNRGFASVERYLPDANRWVMAATLPQGVTKHSAVVLPDGGVLIAGGADSDDAYAHPLTAAWRYDPTQDRWQMVAPMLEPRAASVGLALSDGRALIIGGVGGGTGTGPSMQSAELYDAHLDQWQLRFVQDAGFVGYQRAALLLDGRILVADGDEDFLYDPRQDHWSRAAPGDRLAIAGSLTSLPDGSVLQVAGKVQAHYDPTQNQWQVGQRAISRTWHTATLLPDGRVVLIGGQDVERYGPGHDVDFVQP